MAPVKLPKRAPSGDTQQQLPRGPKDQKIRDFERDWQFRARMKFSSEAPTAALIFCGEIETSRLKISSGSEVFWSLGPLGRALLSGRPRVRAVPLRPERGCPVPVLTDRAGSGCGSWKKVPTVPVPLSVSGEKKKVPMVPVSGSGSWTFLYY